MKKKSGFVRRFVSMLLILSLALTPIHAKQTSAAELPQAAPASGTVPSPASVSFASEKKDTTPASDFQGDIFTVHFQTVSQWGNTFQAEIRITNTGEQPIRNWMLSFSMKNKITSLWDANIQSSEQGSYLIRHAGWNRDIAAGQTVRFGFTAEGTLTDVPESYSLCAGKAEQSRDAYAVDYQVNSQWEGGFTGQFTITNLSKTVLEDWILDFDFEGSITDFWTAELIAAENGHYSIKNAGYNANIQPGESLVLGFQGRNPGEIKPSGYRLSTLSCLPPEETESPEPPSGEGIEELFVQKESFFTGESAENRICVRLNPSRTEAASVYICPEGSDTHAAELYDNGILANGDEIKNDGIYSALMPVHYTEPGTFRYLAAVTDAAGRTVTKAFSIRVYDRMTAQEEAGLYALNARTDAFLAQLLNAESPELPDMLEQTAEYLRGEAAVSQVKKLDRGLEVVYKYGFSSLICLDDSVHIRSMSRGGTQTTEEYNAYLKEKYSQYSGTESCTSTGSGRILIWAPFDTEWGDSDEASLAPSVLGGAGSELSARVDIIRDTEADADSLKKLSQYGLVILATHGGNGEWLATGETVGAEPSGNGPLLQTGEKKIVKRVDLTGKEIRTNYAVTDKWIRSNLADSLPDTIILNNSCESLKTDQLWSAFKSRGASACLGYSGAITNECAVLNALQLLDELAAKNNPVCLAYAASCDTYFDAAGSFLLVRGQANIKLPFQGENANFSFESGLRGWELEGDVRLLSSLGSLTPTDGENMCFVSTGTGYTNALGLFKQTITIPEGAGELSFDWNYLSEEFLEYIGSEYDDPFCVELLSDTGEASPLLRTGVNRIAADFQASKANGGKLVRVSPEIEFDQGDVWMTGWQHGSADVSGYAGKELTLQFSTKNASDTIYTTAILIDNIRIDGKGSQDEAVSRIPLDPEDFGDETILGLVRAAVDPGLIEELKALNLPWLLEGALTSFAGSLVIPGAVLDAICGVGVLVTVAFYWKDLCRVWDQVVAIFQKYIAGPVEDAFNELRDRIEGKDQAGRIEQELQDVASKYGDGYCIEAAKAMAKVLKKHKKEYGFARLLMIPRGFIASEMYPKREVTNNGVHWGIIYDGKIYCNIHITGLPKEMWKNDFYGRYPIKYEEFKTIH